MAKQRKQEPDQQDVIKDDPVEYFGGETDEEPGPRFIDAGDEEIEEDDDFGKGTTAVG